MTPDNTTADQTPRPRSGPFHVSLTCDFVGHEGRLRYQDIGLAAIDDQPQIGWSFFESHSEEIQPQQLASSQGVIVLSPRVTANSLRDADNLLAIGRFGVGYDGVDVLACTERDIALFITAGAVDWSVAEATVGWILALTHHTRNKDRFVREGRWHDRNQCMGSELRDRTLGVIGFGGIGRAVVNLLRGFRMHTPLVFDPYLTTDQAIELGVRSVSLETLLREADFVSVHCPLNETTRDLIDAQELSWMKESAFLINTARGGIINEDSLYAVLAEKKIAGAAIDCFVGEPLVGPARWKDLDNVLLAPHSIAWTNELFRDIGRAAWQGMIDLSHGKRPLATVNPEVFDRPGFQRKWQQALAAIKMM